jgi:hypothetical protein
MRVLILCLALAACGPRAVCITNSGTATRQCTVSGRAVTMAPGCSAYAPDGIYSCADAEAPADEQGITEQEVAGSISCGECD